jgi:Peptidase A4 family
VRAARISSVVSVIGAAVALLYTSPALASVDHHGPNRRIAFSTSSNWSGYAVSGFGSYTSVSSSWTQPAVDCSVTPTGYSAFWVGLDGDTDNTVEQTGTEGDCSNGTASYYAWYEMYPKGSVTIRHIVKAGDAMNASVTYLGRGEFELTLNDSTQKWTASTEQKLQNAKLASAEAIAEAPFSGGVLPLADFGTMGFSSVNVNGTQLTSSTPGLDPITMASGTTVEAMPSGLSNGSFTDTWKSA